MLSRFWRFCFRLLYHELAFTYDIVSRMVSLGHWRGWQRSALQFLPEPGDGIILEIAHGAGDLQIELQRRGYQAAALDLSPQMGRLAKRKLLRANLGVNLVRADALRLPYRSRAIGAVVCAFPTSFIFSQAVLGELARVLQPTGRAVVVLVGQLQGRGIARTVIRLLYRLTGQRDALLNNTEVRALFCASAFRVESRVVTVADSAVQVAVLAPLKECDQRQPDIALDIARLS